ncbi:MAG: hypothetical protein Kow00124_17050 [Anaerolineae bacterium]
MQNRHILIVEDDLGLAEMLEAFLSMQGFHVLATPSGKQAVDLVAGVQPVLILLDIRLPDIDGFEVYRMLGERHATRYIPVIFLTEMSDRVDRLTGLGLGASDYITKPFDIYELWLRVRNVLHRVEVGYTTNPITGLPEGQVVDQALQQTLHENRRDSGMLVVTLGGVSAFRELYGFMARDDVLRVTGLTLATAAHELGGERGFCGHLDDHTFLILLPRPLLGLFRSTVMERLGNCLDYFYPTDNRQPNAHTEDRLRLLFGAVEPGLVDAHSLRQEVLRVQQSLSLSA